MNQRIQFYACSYDLLRVFIHITVPIAKILNVSIFTLQKLQESTHRYRF